MSLKERLWKQQKSALAGECLNKLWYAWWWSWQSLKIMHRSVFTGIEESTPVIVVGKASSKLAPVMGLLRLSPSLSCPLLSPFSVLYLFLSAYLELYLVWTCVWVWTAHKPVDLEGERIWTVAVFIIFIFSLMHFCISWVFTDIHSFQNGKNNSLFPLKTIRKYMRLTLAPVDQRFQLCFSFHRKGQEPIPTNQNLGDTLKRWHLTCRDWALLPHAEVMELFNHNFYCFNINMDEYFIKTECSYARRAPAWLALNLPRALSPLWGILLYGGPPHSPAGQGVKATEIWFGNHLSSALSEW